MSELRCGGKGDKESQTSIRFNNENFEGHLTCSFPKNRSNKVHRLWISEDLKEELKRTFVMSHMRDIESGLRGDVGDICTAVISGGVLMVMVVDAVALRPLLSSARRIMV